MRKNTSGFTIVELLVVIVVIAVLAAISIVSYNGIQKRAQESTAQALLAQTNRAILAHFAGQDTYPATLGAAGITNTEGLQYTVDNNASPKTYCLTAANGNASFYLGSSQSTAQSGACTGHGTPGHPVITNLITNPSAEVNLSGGWSPQYGGGSGTLTRGTDGGAVGSSYVRQSWTTAPTSQSTGAWLNYATSPVITSGSTYSASIYVRPSKSQRMALQIWWFGGSGGPAAVGTPQVVPANTWTRLTVTGTTPPTSNQFYLIPWSTSGAGQSNWAAGDYLDVDAAMMTRTDTAPAYADGSSSGWSWSGTAHNSLSSGPTP